MKIAHPSKPFPTSPEEIEAAIAKAPRRVDDPDCPYDPNDAAAVEAFWKTGTVRRSGPRGPGLKHKKVLLSVRYSPEVVEFFKATGEGWQQALMDEALKEWMADRKSA